MADTTVIRVPSDDDWPAVHSLVGHAFHSPPREDESTLRDLYEPSRALVTVDVDTDEIVGHTVAFSRALTVPGASVPAAHISAVAVAPTHRRQGLLRRMMVRQHQEARDAGDVLGVLWASEAAIYTRYGYGMASMRTGFTVDADRVRLPEPSRPGRVRSLTVETAKASLPPVYETLRPRRPGWSTRDTRWWAHRLQDTPAQRKGGTPLRVTLHEGPDGPDGYVLWNSRQRHTPGDVGAEIQVRELTAGDASAALRLWRFLTSVDLVDRVTYPLTHPQDPLLLFADDPGRLDPEIGDGLWVRLLDLPTALSTRRYAAPVDLVLEVSDDMLPANAGRWRLTGGPDGATCVPVDQTFADAPPADLVCDIADLGAAYLGGTGLGTLADAGRVTEHRPGALATAHAAFGWPHAPSALEVF